MAVNLQRRKAVMARSIKLGHCVCNPASPCPCDVFTRHNICPCAGERLPARGGTPPLTRTVRRAGCASKIGQADLLRVLGQLPPVDDPNILVGTAAGDDAGIYRIDAGRALVQTVDVFTPCVDDPHLFGMIAAANSLSDVYAMGGTPLTALSVIGFPADDLDLDIMATILRGAMVKLSEAGCALLGGHSFLDEEIKCGFAITGHIDPSRCIQRSGARAGDAIVLTKPLGTGMVSFASQIERLGPEDAADATSSMIALNRDAGRLMFEHGAHACTDVTGFGLAGHLVEMARAGSVCAEIDIERVPVFAAACYCIDNDILPGAIERNEEYSMAWVQGEDGTIRLLPIIYDPQTSGGLLVALPPAQAEQFVGQMQSLGHTASTVIGRFVAAGAHAGTRPGVLLHVHGNGFANVIGTPPHTASVSPRAMQRHELKEPDRMSETTPPDCCSHPPTRDDPSSADNATVAFAEFMKQASQPTLIDGRTKKLMAIALSIAQRCRPCLAIHIRGALAMGITRAEIDEAANLAIAFAGCPAMMLYKEIWSEVGD